MDIEISIKHCYFIRSMDISGELQRTTKMLSWSQTEAGLGTNRSQSNNETQSIFWQLERWPERGGASAALVWALARLSCPALRSRARCVSPKEDSWLQESGLTVSTVHSRSALSAWRTHTAQRTSSYGPKEASSKTTLHKNHLLFPLSNICY